MSYDQPLVINHTLPLFDYGGGAAEVYSFRGPAGKKGRITKIGVMVTETFTATTKAKMEVGTAADPDAFALLDFTGDPADLDFWDETDDTDAIISEIPADTLVQVKHTPGVTSPAGQGIPIITIQWY